MKMLFEVSIKGGISSSRLAALGCIAEKNGINAAKKYRPKQHNFGTKSWIRETPLQKEKRFERPCGHPRAQRR